MTLGVTVVSAVLVLGLALIGALRDLSRGILVLTGALFGVALVSVWGGPLAEDLARRVGAQDPTMLERFANLTIFAAATLVLGFGAGLLLPRTDGATVVSRLAGTLLGAFTGVLVGGFGLTYASAGNPAFLEALRASPVGAPLYTYLPLLLAGGALLVALAVLTRILLKLFAGRTAPAEKAPAPAAQPPNPSTAPPTVPQTSTQRENEKTVLNRINDRLS